MANKYASQVTQSTIDHTVVLAIFSTKSIQENFDSTCLTIKKNPLLDIFLDRHSDYHIKTDYDRPFY